MEFTFANLFAGIGGMRLGANRAGARCVFVSEWNVYSQQTYRAWHGSEPPISGDINLIEPSSVPDHALLTAGFPCQPFSIAGVSKNASLGRAHGFKDLTRGTMFFKIAAILEAKQTPVVVLENVKNLLRHDGGRTWATIKATLEELGYEVFCQVLDSQDFGVPQHRERVFIVGFLTRIFGKSVPFTYPAGHAKTALGSILEEAPAGKYTLSDKMWAYLQAYKLKHQAAGNGFGFGLVGPGSVTRTLSARYGKDGSEILVEQPGRNPRRLTPRECARLMGFPDSLPIVVSDAQAYKQFGNSVCVCVAEAVVTAVADAFKNKAIPLFCNPQTRL